MRVASVRAGTVAAGTLAAAALAPALAVAPAAHADDLDIAPATGRAGRTVTVTGGCQPDDRRVIIGGAARGSGKVDDGWFSVRARVVPERAGSYRIRAVCKGSGFTQEGLVSVTARMRKELAEPRGWAETGGGGTQGNGLGWSLTGLALMACAAGIGATVLLRTRAARGRP